jgi:hypothetical protein
MRCARCADEITDYWSTIEMFSRVGNLKALDLCQACTTVAYAFVLNRPLHQEANMTVLWSYPISDPFDIDDAEHPIECGCPECDATDTRFEMERERRYA